MVHGAVIIFYRNKQGYIYMLIMDILIVHIVMLLGNILTILLFR